MRGETRADFLTRIKGWGCQEYVSGHRDCLRRDERRRGGDDRAVWSLVGPAYGERARAVVTLLGHVVDGDRRMVALEPLHGPRQFEVEPGSILRRQRRLS